MAEKPRIQDAGPATGPRADEDQAAAANADSPQGTAGQLAHDDRGNISWQWSEGGDLQADDVVGRSARIRALAPADLSLAEDADLAQINKEPIPVRRSPRGGYNPYDSGEPTKQSWKKKRDLRQLAKWIELKKKLKDKDG